MKKICSICDTTFNVRGKRQITAKYCSVKCKAISQKGKVFWINTKGVRTNTGRTHFKKGMTAWNKGVKTGLVPKSAFKKGDNLGEKHFAWKGDTVGYVGLHRWVRRMLGESYKCEQCNSMRFVQWANKSGEYKRDLTDWVRLCRKCHHRYDNISEKIWATRQHL